MITAIAVAATAAVVGIVAALIQRRTQAHALPARMGPTVPGQLHRRDFVRPDAEWLVVLFSSTTCETCATVWSKCQPLESESVAVQNVTYQNDRALHDRYAIDSVPLVTVADSEGVVLSSFAGPIGASELWAAVAAVRDAGTATRPGSAE